MDKRQPRSLQTVIENFARHFNQNSRARKLTMGWDRLILIGTPGAEPSFALHVREGRIQNIETSPSTRDLTGGVIRVKAEEDILKEVFAGHYRLPVAVRDGVLEIDARERDAVKIRALELVLSRQG